MSPRPLPDIFLPYEELCPNCKGTGEISYREDCTTCTRGLMEDGSKCPACNGTGEIFPPEVIRCDNCKGNGHVLNEQGQLFLDFLNRYLYADEGKHCEVKVGFEENHVKDWPDY